MTALLACERAADPETRTGPIRLATTQEMLHSGLPAALAKASGLDVQVVLHEAQAPADIVLLPGEEGWLFATTRLVLVGPQDESKRSYGEHNYEVGAHAPNDDWTTTADAELLLYEISLSTKPLVTSSGPPLVAEREQQLMKKMLEDGPYEWRIEARGALSDKLRIASEKHAYALVDLATFVRERGSLRIGLVMARDPRFRVDYRVQRRTPEAQKLFDWFGSAPCREFLRRYLVRGKRIFFLPNEHFPTALWGRLDPPPYPEEEY
ncbi:MAG: hypothetical protein AAGD14_10490 [Planctomycetota bacterium]